MRFFLRRLSWIRGALASVSGLLLIAAGPGAIAQSGPRPNLVDNIGRPLRYRPDGTDFVIENGAEFFNRPLYGRNTAARFDAGDRPEFTFYLPGRGGNLRLGLRTASAVKWLHDAQRIVTRYRPGMMLYEIRDPLLGAEGVLNLTVLALAATDGLILRVAVAGTPSDLELVWAYGGLNGQRGSRDGDLAGGASLTPQFQLRPEYCREDTFTIQGGAFTLHHPLATLVGTGPVEAQLAVADAAKWSSLAELLASSGGATAAPVVVGRAGLRTGGTPLFLAVQRTSDVPVKEEELPVYLEVTADRPGLDRRPPEVSFLPAYTAADLPRVFAETDAHFQALREQVTVETPDPYINAAVPALNIAADGVWDETQGAVMHGAIAWRTKLLGWRGPYVMDELGWHDRARRHFSSWATRQNTDPVPEKIPPPDEASNLARSEAALHSNGDISNSHYDMNTVYIDAVFRHLLWTGDRAFARQMWPVIERHLAWERRLFRREYGPEKLPLYEAYTVIWAGDDIQYGGGGTTHGSAYNYYHNKMAARLARLLGHDDAPYECEAALIARAMRELLWLPDGGFAEYKDYLGRQLVHPDAAVWSFYHTIDSEVPTPQEAWQMTRQVDTQIPHLPIRGPGVPADDDYHVVATSDWMPYSWSVNNVVLAEIAHTALGYWQAGRADEAFRLTKGALLASMYLGMCPGDIGTMNYLDVYRRESQRDFADGGGVLSRALIEGLFGVKPDALAGELRIVPGFPAQWDHANLRHPNLTFTFRRDGLVDTYAVEPRFGASQKLRLQVVARRDQVAGVTVNGRPGAWRVIEDAVGEPRIEITADAAARQDVIISWTGGVPETAAGPAGAVAFSPARQGQMSWWRPAATPPPARPRPEGMGGDWTTKLPAAQKWESVDLSAAFNDRVTQIFRNEYRAPRSPFVSLALPKQGIGGWAGSFNARPDINDAGLRAAAAAQGGRIMLPNGVPLATPGPGEAKNIVFTSQWDNYPREVTVPLGGHAQQVYLLMAGSTYWMQSHLDNGEIVVNYRDGGHARLALRNPDNWWPIDQDYFIDDFSFARPGALPPRVDLQTGRVRLLDETAFQGQGRAVPGGAATVLALPLEPGRELQSLTLRTLANDVVIGLMAATLER